VVAINGWNRLAISFRAVPGTYQPQQHPQAASAPRGSQLGKRHQIPPADNTAL
jgi:hypothetical protein